jgi:hypothetical protein
MIAAAPAAVEGTACSHGGASRCPGPAAGHPLERAVLLVGGGVTAVVHRGAKSDDAVGHPLIAAQKSHGAVGRIAAR